MTDKILTAKEALSLTGLVIKETNPNLFSIISKIKELATQGKFYLIIKADEVDACDINNLNNLGYQVHFPLEFLDVCVIKWNPIKIHISSEELSNPISLKTTNQLV